MCTLGWIFRFDGKVFDGQRRKISTKRKGGGKREG